jgi:hypothetical protein
MADLPSTEKVVNTYRQVTIYYDALEKLAAKYETADKGRAAMAAVGLTIRFWQRLNVDRSLLAALIEAQLIIERSIDGNRTEKKQEMERDAVDCVALFYRPKTIKKPAALKAIVGSDPGARSHLENFYKKMMSGQKPEARAQFEKMKELFADMTPEESWERALRACTNLRGKKVQKAR